ncbi:MAG: hypothetical protein KKC50_08200 [Candidatus Omnitrophica bacterium]|nr:hypothetical protein [Candidatus Omnitrophota bacterium]
MRIGTATVSRGVLLRNVSFGLLRDIYGENEIINEYEYLQDVNNIDINDVNGSPIKVLKTI